jgi:S-formylglutathione hydrolase FrmB
VSWRVSAVVALVAAALSAAAPAPAVPSPVCVPRAAPIAVGLDLVGQKPLSARASELTFTSAAMAGLVHAVVLLPAGYDPQAARTYPVLYLLHGHGGRGYLDWPNHGVEGVVGDAPVIVVIPEGGYDGWYSDWYGTDVDGHIPPPAPAWETFHVRELLPWIDGHYRTQPSRAARAIAGNSMGGFGAASYAARHPDLFVALGTFSGAVHPLIAWPVGPVALSVASNGPDQRPPDSCIWGDPVTQRVRWVDHDPTELAANLRSLTIYQRAGNGVPGRHTDPSASPSPAGIFTEAGIGLMNRQFDAALDHAGVRHTVVFENGVHDWPYWLDDLRQFLPRAMYAFAHPRPASPFTYKSGAASFSVWGWTFDADHADEEALVTVERVSARGLTAYGGGRLDVLTAPLYTPAGSYRVDGHLVRADTTGRLRFVVPLRSRGAQVRITPL